MIAETFHDEIRQFTRSLAIYNLRHHLSKYPRDLVRHWLRVEGALPVASCSCAYRAYKSGEPAKRVLYKGSPHFPQLRLIKC